MAIAENPVKLSVSFKKNIAGAKISRITREFHADTVKNMDLRAGPVIAALVISLLCFPIGVAVQVQHAGACNVTVL